MYSSINIPQKVQWRPLNTVELANRSAKGSKLFSCLLKCLRLYLWSFWSSSFCLVSFSESLPLKMSLSTMLVSTAILNTSLHHGVPHSIIQLVLESTVRPDIGLQHLLLASSSSSISVLSSTSSRSATWWTKCQQWTKNYSLTQPSNLPTWTSSLMYLSHPKEPETLRIERSKEKRSSILGILLFWASRCRTFLGLRSLLPTEFGIESLMNRSTRPSHMWKWRASSQTTHRISWTSLNSWKMNIWASLDRLSTSLLECLR